MEKFINNLFVTGLKGSDHALVTVHVRECPTKKSRVDHRALPVRVKVVARKIKI